MTAGTGHGASSSRYAVLLPALAVLAAAFAFVAPAAVRAQEAERPGLLNRLFGAPAYRIEEPPAEFARPRVVRPEAAKPKAERTQRKKKPRVQREGEQPPQIAVVTKRPDARVVLVIGDFLGSGLAEGLTTAFTQSQNVRIVDRTSGSSGFVREDFLNWPEKVNELITTERPAAIIVMIGANDRQQMLVDGARETVRSENWNREYAERAEELAKAISARNVPFLWVGMPPFKASKVMLDMLAFNDIYRAAATSGRGEFVDIWDGFVDENGAYVQNGPDINGQPARLRAADGINLARPGKRKVAFYAEKLLYKLLGEDPASPAAAPVAIRAPYRIMGPFGPSETEAPSDIDIAVDPNELGPLDPGRPVALRTPALDGGTELLGEVAEPRQLAQTPAEKLAIQGIAPAPLAGRADQSAGPQLAMAAVAAMRQVNLDLTRNKRAAPSVLGEPEVDRAALRSVRSNVLTQPQPDVPPRRPPEIATDRLEEISRPQAAPDTAAPPPLMTTPATIGKASAPDLARGDPVEMAPSRGAPDQAYKRPKSIGPEPNRAPTAVPQPVQEVLPPAETQEEIPTASNTDSPEASAEAKPALPDTAPARVPAPSIVPEIVEHLAPAREAPRKAVPVPVASLPEAKDAPSELLPPPEAPQVLAPSVPVEITPETSVAKAVPSLVEPADIPGSGPAARSAPSVLTAPIQPALQRAPTAVPISAEPIATPPATGSEEAAAVPAAPAGPTVSAPTALSEAASADEPVPTVAPAAPASLPESRGGAAESSSEASAPATPVVPAPTAPAPLAMLPDQPGDIPAASPSGLGTAAQVGQKIPAASETPAEPRNPAIPPAPAAPTVLPENAAVPSAPTPAAATALPAVPSAPVPVAPAPAASTSPVPAVQPISADAMPMAAPASQVGIVPPPAPTALP